MKSIVNKSPYLLGALALCAASSCKEATKVAPKTPNVIYILADDLGYGDLGCYGSTKIETPNIDKLASQGMLFTQHYSGCTVSAPSRSTLLTGQHTGHTSIRGNRELVGVEGQLPISAESYTIAELFKDAGYTTGAFGKWGLGTPGSEGDPNAQGFDEFFGYNCQRQAHRYYPEHLWLNDKKVMMPGNDGNKEMVTYAPDVIQKEALEFIKANKDSSFFAYLAFVQPHAELIAPEDSILDKYRKVFTEETPFVSKYGDAANYGSEDFEIKYYCDQEEPHATFAAMVSRLDMYVGEVMATLDSLGIADNTVIMFSSDNGPHLEGGADPDFFNSNGPHRGYKRDMSDGGIRAPFIVRWNGVVAPGSTSDHISAFWDILPTMSDIAGVKLNTPTDGISMIAELKGEKQKEHDFLYWEYAAAKGQMAVRMGDFKAIRLNVNKDKDAPIELYNVVDDPEELNNLAAQNSELVAKAAKVMSEEHTLNENFPFEFER